MKWGFKGAKFDTLLVQSSVCHPCRQPLPMPDVICPDSPFCSSTPQSAHPTPRHQLQLWWKGLVMAHVDNNVHRRRMYAVIDMHHKSRSFFSAKVPPCGISPHPLVLPSPFLGPSCRGSEPSHPRGTSRSRLPGPEYAPHGVVGPVHLIPRLRSLTKGQRGRGLALGPLRAAATSPPLPTPPRHQK